MVCDKSYLQFSLQSFQPDCNLWIQKIPGDGNCLFGSLAHQLLDVHPLEETFFFVVAQLRASVVRFIREHLDRFQNYLIPFAEDYVDVSLNAEEKVMRYLDLLSVNGTWGGEECISAVSELLSAAITVWDSRTCRRIEYLPASIHHTAPKRANIYYNGTHYDSISWVSDLSLFSSESVVASVETASKVFDVIRFDTHPYSLIKSFLHQLHIPCSESEAAMLHAALIKFRQLTSTDTECESNSSSR